MSNLAKRGDWVQIHTILLTPDQRAHNLPQETREVPLEKRVKGFLVDEEAIRGDEVTIESVIGREHKGKLVAINPSYEHNFGSPIPELSTIGRELRKRLSNE